MGWDGMGLRSTEYAGGRRANASDALGRAGGDGHVRGGVYSR